MIEICQVGEDPPKHGEKVEIVSDEHVHVHDVEKQGEGVDPAGCCLFNKKSVLNEIVSSSDFNDNVMDECHVTEIIWKKLFREKTVIDLDSISMSRLLNFEAESSESEGSDSDYEEEVTADSSAGKELSSVDTSSAVKESSVDTSAEEALSSTILYYEDDDVFSSPLRQTAMPYRLNTAEMHSRLQAKEEINRTWSPLNSSLHLSLEEVAHIRDVHTKAYIDSLPVADNVRKDVMEGRICFQCKNTRFGLFRRAKKCQVCKHFLCSKCVVRVSTTPKVSISSRNKSTPHPESREDQKDVEDEAASKNTIITGLSTPIHSRCHFPDCVLSPLQQGSILSVCHDCQKLLLQVSRSGETNARMVAARSAIFSNFVQSALKLRQDPK